VTFVKGQQFTIEHRRRLSEAKRGKATWNKGKKGMPGTNLGRKFDDTWRKNLRKSHIGQKPWNTGLKGYLAKENHWNWKGGITKLHFQIRHCYEYRLWRNDVFTRDGFSCVLCGSTGCYLNADHYPVLFSEIFRKYKFRNLEEARKCSELWDINNGRTLCERCHYKVTWRKEIND
jgi:hypothetical protein